MSKKHRQNRTPDNGAVAVEERPQETPNIPLDGPRFKVRVEESQTQDEPSEGPSTSMKLFPDFVKDGVVTALPVEEEEKPVEHPEEPKKPEEKEPPAEPTKEAPPAEETPKPEETPPAETPPVEPKAEEFLNIENLQGKKVRVKVDGIEMDVPAETLLKNYQIEAHLNRKGQRLNDQERALREIQQSLNKPKLNETQEEIPAEEETSAMASIRRELEETKAALQQVSRVTAKIAYEEGINSIDQHVKATLGFDDFKAHVPKIQEFVKSQLLDPSNPTREEIALYDSPGFYVQKYQEMKLRELQKQAPAKVVAPVTPAPKLGKITEVEPGSGSRAETETESLNVQYQKAYARAIKEGSEEAWMEVMRLKRAKGSEE
jgi:hypothetical protein